MKWTNTLMPPSVPGDHLVLPGKPRAVRRVLPSHAIHCCSRARCSRLRRRTEIHVRADMAVWAGVLKTLGLSYADAARAERQPDAAVMPHDDALPLLSSMRSRSDEKPYVKWCAI